MPAPPRLRRKRTEPRLDPVRWRRPGRGPLMRMIVVAALLIVGAAATWTRQPACAPPAAPSPGGQPPARGTARPTPAATAGSPSSAAAAEIPAAAVDGTEGPAGGEQGAHPIPPGRVGVPVRLAEPAALTLVRPGDRVDLLRVDGTGHGTSAVATGAPVLDVTGADDPTSGGLLLALRPGEAQTAVAAQGRGFAVVIRPA